MISWAATAALVGIRNLAKQKLVVLELVKQ